jgi:hypothetical protein
MDRYLQLADGMAAGQVADGVSNEEKNGPSTARGGSQLRKGMALIWRKPVLQEVDIVGHALT